LRQTRENISNKILDKKLNREQGKDDKENFRVTFQKQKQQEMRRNSSKTILRE